MGKLPLQTPKEVQANLKSLGFVFKNQVGSHKQYERPADATRQRAVVTVDVGKSQFSKDLMKNMIRCRKNTYPYAENRSSGGS